MKKINPFARLFSPLLAALTAGVFMSCLPNAQALLTITYSPQSATNTLGDNVEFAVRATNASNPTDTLTYQWTNSEGVVVGSSTNLVLLSVLTTSADTYTVVVTDATASQTAMASATLTVNATFSPTAGLVAWLPFNDGVQYGTSSQEANDASGNGNFGTLQNFENDGGEWVSGVTGAGGGALYFANVNGNSNNVVTIHDAANLNPTNNLAFTISLWVAGETWTTFDGSYYDSPFASGQLSGANLFSKGYGGGGEQFELDAYTSGDFRFYVRNAGGTVSSVASGTAVNNNGVWQHVVCTFDGNAGVSRAIMYINGVSNTSFAAPSSLIYSSQTVNIGNRASSSTSGYNSPFIGVIDDARIYNYALSASDVSALYSSYSPSTVQPAVFEVPTTTNQPIFSGGNFPLYPFETGMSAMTFGWTFNGTGTLVNPTTAACAITNLTAGGTATVTVTNAQGTTSQSFTINPVTPYGYAAEVMALNPLVYWPLDETTARTGTGTTVGYDYVKGNNACVGNGTTIGVNGPSSPQYQGFPANHKAMGCVQSSTSEGFATAGPFGLNTATPTFTAWIYTTQNTQANSSGLIFDRQSGDTGGMDYNSGINYTWNNGASSTYNFSSKLEPTNGVWTFAAIAVGSSSTIAYMGGPDGILHCATNAVGNSTVYQWSTAGLVCIGQDPNSSTKGAINSGRTFIGDISDAAVYNNQLTLAQIQSLYYSAGIAPSIPSMLASTNLNVGSNFTNTVSGIGGSLPITYTWYYQPFGGGYTSLLTGTLTSYSSSPVVVSGTTQGVYSWSTNLVLTNVQASQSGNYYLVLQNAYGQTYSNTVVNIYGSPNITGPFPINPVIFPGSNITFSVIEYAGSPVTNQWYTNGTPVPGATGTNVTLTAPPVGTYTVTFGATNSFSPSGISSSTTLTVQAAPTYSFPQAVLALNPVGYWRMNEPDDGLGDNNDSQICHDYISGDDGMYTNAVLGQAGYNVADSSLPTYDPETSADFGVDSTANSCAYNIPNIDFSKPAGSNVTFTIQAWARSVNSSGNTPAVVGKGIYNNEEFTIDAGNDVSGVNYYRFEVRSAALTAYNANSTVKANDNKWHFLVGVCDEVNSNVTLYIDGTNAGSVAITNKAGLASTDASLPMSIGARSSTGASYDQQFVGNINDVAVFNYALTASQIQNEYFQAGIAPTVTLPTNSITVNEDGTFTETATAYGTPPLAYQWYYEDPSFNVYSISGATNATLVWPDVQSSYYGVAVVVTNAYGTAESGATYLTVNDGQAYIETDISPLNIDVPPGTMLSYSVLAYGADPIDYEWLADGTVVPGATNASYSFAAALGTNTYQCGVSNSQNSSWALGHIATVVAGNAPPVVGFKTNGSGWSLQGTNYIPTIVNNVLTLTTAAASEATSAYYNNLEYISNGFVATFTYTPSGGTSPPANGIAFVLQNSSLGPQVIGTGGGGFGYFGTTPSVAFQMNIYSGASGGVGIEWATNGTIGGNGGPANGPTGSVNIESFDAINVTITYASSSNNVQVTLADPSKSTSYTTNYATGNLATILGGVTAYVGFTGGTGSDDAIQEISDFSFVYTAPQEAPELVQDISPLNADVPVGAAMTYSVEVIGTVPLSYVWLENSNVIAGATNASYTFAAPAGTNYYQCGVSNLYSGGVYTYSSLATLVAATTSPGVGFGNGSLWQLQGNNNFSPTISGGVLTLTSAAGNEASSAYYTIPQYVNNGFAASFTYQPSAGSSTRADGTAFVLQNSPSGPFALGAGGGGMAVDGTSPSAEFVLDLYSGSPGGTGINWTTNGLTAQNGGAANTGTGSVNINNLDPINVTITYEPNAGEVQVNLVDTISNLSYSTTYTVGSMASLVGGNTAYVGFTAATGGDYAGQVVSNFSFTYAGSAAAIEQGLTPSNWTAYASESLSYAAVASGDAPLSYAWFMNSNVIAGATNSTYTFTIPLGTNYFQCGVSNAYSGGIYSYTSPAEVIGILPPTDPYGANLFSYGPVAYWRLNETAGSATAYDYAGGFNGTYGSQTTNGQPGIPHPPFLGEPLADLGVWMDNTTASGSTNGFVTTPAMNITVSNATLLCWIYPNGSQANSEGLVFGRNGPANGINYGAGNAMVYTWDNAAATYDWASGLTVPTNTWSMLALVITPSNAVEYVFNTNGLIFNTNAVTNPPVTFAGGFAIGADPQTSTLPGRIFNGEMDEVAVFDYALTAPQLNSIYSVAQTGLSLSIQQSSTNIILSWPFGVLYQSANANGPWMLVPGATSPYTNNLSGNQEFYRIIAAP